MEDYSLALKKVAKFPKAFPEHHGSEEKAGLQPEGGTFRNGEYGWLSAGSYLEIVEMSTGFKVSRFDFASQFGDSFAQISTIVDLELPDFSTPVLAIGFRTDSTDSGFICLFSVHGARPLDILQFPDSVSVLHPLLSVSDDEKVLYRDFDGCLIVGFDSGKTALIDLNVRDLQQRLLQTRREFTDPVPCVTIPSDASEEEIRKCHKAAHRQNCAFGLDLKLLEDAGPVLSLLPLPQMRTLAVGLCDGRLVLYHLDGNMDAYHLALPPEPMAPLVAMAFMEPADDPKACAYLWAFHEAPEMAIAVMHSLVFESRRDTNYERFQSCRVRLTMPIQDRGSVPISCQAICQPLSSAEESLTCVCLLAWRTERKTSMLMLFDLNQWYKEQMPWVGNWRDMPRYVAIYPLNEDPLAVRLDARSLSWFNSLDRPEEHFYPTAMGFDCLLLTYKGSGRYHWPGLQNRALNMLEYCGPNAILEPDMCYRAMLNGTLVPQFSEESFKLDSPLAKKRELLLSIALEYNCVGLLKRCARVWADGSHMGRDPSRGLSLATLTDWIWSRSSTIKQYCNTMCVPLFDYSGRQLGTAEQKRLSHCGVQLKWLSEIMDMIMTTCNQYIPEEILEQLKEQQRSIQIAAEYQEVLVWMFNMGLLPECNGTTMLPASLDSSVGSGNATSPSGERPIVSMVYPYELLNNFYRQKREQFFEADRKYAQNAPAWNSCSMLYIDALLDRECGGVGLYRDWREDGGSGLYPPRSLQSMLRVLLLPTVSIQSKYSIFMYLFMDLNVVYQDHECHALVQNLYKFPTAFKMSPDTIKLIESFWHLDHNNFEEAVVDLKASSMTKWQLELMVECLFLHQWPHLSLRALQMPGPSISPVIEMRVLLGNNLISEAFLFQKKHGDKSLLLEFFNSCFKLGTLRAILRLPLTETEGQLLGEFLMSVDSSMPRNLHFVYLLQRSKYVEAVDLVESVRLRKGQPPQLPMDTGTVSAVLSTYKATMPPMYQEMSDIYRRTGAGAGGGHAPRSSMTPSMLSSTSSQVEQSGRTALATPLSSQLIRNKVDVNSSVYQMAITAVKEATNYSLFQSQQQNQSIRSPNKFTSIPFLRKPLQETMYEHETSAVIYPKIVEGNAEHKRKTGNEDADEHFTKRRKLDDINTGLLTSFEPTKVDRMLEFSQRKAMPVSSQLSTPIVKRVANANNSANVSPRGGGKMTPHSILKARNIFRDSPGPEEKILRFKQASVSPGIFDVSAIKRPQEEDAGVSVAGRPFAGPKPRRSIRSVTPEDHILSSTRNHIDVEETRPAGNNNNKLADLEAEIKSRMTAVAAEEEEQRVKDTTTMTTYSPKRELRSQAHENVSPGKDVEDVASDEPEEAAEKLGPIMPRRSLRSRTPEQVSPRAMISRSASTKKTLTRMVLESNAKRNLLERAEEIPEADETYASVGGNNTTLDSTLPMSEYSLNVDRDPLATDRTILADNSDVSDSLLGGWRERLRGQADTTRDSFVSDASGMASVSDVLVETPNQSLQFVASDQCSVNRSLEEEMEVKMNELDQLKEDTVYQPEVRETKEVEEEIREADVEDQEVNTEEVVSDAPNTPTTTNDGQFKIPTPPKSNRGTSKIPLLFNQDTFVVAGGEKKDPEEGEKGSPTNLSDEELSPEEDYYDDESDLSNLSNKSEASNDDQHLEERFSEDNSSRSLNDEEDDYEDSEDDDDDDEEAAAAKAKPFKTNEVIDLLDSDEEAEEVKQGTSSDSNGSDSDNFNDGGKDSEEDVVSEQSLQGGVDTAEPVEEYVPSFSVGQLQYGTTFDIAGPLFAEEVVVAEPVDGGHTQEMQETARYSPEQMDADEENGGEMHNIYDDMEVDVVGDDVEPEEEDGNLNDALMVEEDSKDAEMCLRIDEDSQPAATVAEEEAKEETEEVGANGDEQPTFAAESTINALDKAVVMDDSALLEIAEPAEVQVEKIVEVVEVIPPPKVAYQTTEEENSIVVETPVIVEETEEEKVDVEVQPQPETAVELEIAAVVDEAKPEENPEVNVPTTPEIQVNDIPVMDEEVHRQETVKSHEESPMPSTQPEPTSSQQSDVYPAESESSQPEKLTVRRRSVRAVSQPRNSISDELLPSKIRSRRATTETAAEAGTPKRRNSHLFEQAAGAEERLTPNLRMTPMRLARMTESTENLATGTPGKRTTRTLSIESEASGVRTPTTRGTRGRSKAAASGSNEEEDDNVSITSNASRRSLRGKSVAGDTDADDAKSTVSSASATTTKSKKATRAKKTLIDTAIPEEPEMQDYSSSRRLTRNQQHMMERSLKVQNRALDMSSGSTSPGTPGVDESAADSDADSVSSKISRASHTRRSARGLSKESDISESGTSTRSTRSARMKPPTAAKKKLNAIIESEASDAKSRDEDDPSGAGDTSTTASTPPKKRGRKKAQN